MEESKSILHELYVYSEWKPEPEYLQKPDNILPENISALWRWLKYFGPKKSLIDSITAYKERQQKWHIALGDEGKVIAVLTDNILEIRTKRLEYATIAARTTVNRDPYPQWRKLVWSPDCSFVVLAYGNGIVSFFDLTASNLFNIPADCTRPGGLECTDNTHAVAEIIFMPLRVKDNKWSWEVLVVTHDGKLRGYLVSQVDGFKLHHSFRFAAAGGVGAVLYSAAHSTLYVAGVPHATTKDPASPLSAGITAWRILNDVPFYKLSVVSDELEAQLATDRFHVYIPFLSSKNLAFIVHMVISPDGSKLVCLHCNGDLSVWRLPVLRMLYRWPLTGQPGHDLQNPLVAEDRPLKKDASDYYPADVNWWSNEEVIVSRFSGAVTVCDVKDMVNILGKRPEFFQGTPQVTCAHDGAFVALECESSTLPANKSHSDESMEVVSAESELDDSMVEVTKELIKSILYSITDIEAFQPKPRKITIVSRIYRLLGVKSTTPGELFSRKIENGSYTEALALAETFNLDSDLVYQQQWRKNPVSTDAIQKYLSKVSKKIWAVHQCVDRLPETLPAAKELLQFGLQLTNEKILKEINKERTENLIKDPEDITLEDLNAYTSELLRCRHVMLFYKERLRLYEDILKCEKSAYVKDEYDRLRSNSIVQSAIEIAKEGRIEALTCLWPHIKTLPLQLAVLEKLPETLNPYDYRVLLPTKQPIELFEKCSPIKLKPSEHDNDWCRKEIFRSIWSSNWSEDTSPEIETVSNITSVDDTPRWYEARARDIEERSGLVSNAVTLITLVSEGGGVRGLNPMLFHLLTLDTLVYDVGVEDVTLNQVEGMSTLETCTMLMSLSTAESFVSDLKLYIIPFLKRYERLTKQIDVCLTGLTDYLESTSVDDLSTILLVLQSPKEFELDVRTHLELAERCLFAYTGTDQLDKACDLLDTVLKKDNTDGSISNSELVRRVKEMERLVTASTRMSWRGVRVPPRDLQDMHSDSKHAHYLLTRVARSLSNGDQQPTPQDWEKLLKEILELQSTLFQCITREQCYEIYTSSLLTSGDAASIKLAADVLTCEADARRNSHLIDYVRSTELVSNAAVEYFNSASSLTDRSLELARCCLMLIKDGNPAIDRELDLISSLQILHAFGLSMLPIQVRLCEDRMTLIEECLKLDQNAYLASHKLLKLAKLLRIAGDDEQTREGKVLERVGEYAVRAGPGGCAAAAEAARRLAALRHAPAASFLAHVAKTARAHADRAARRHLLAAAAKHCTPDALDDILKARLGLELEGLQQMGVAIKEHRQLDERCPSTDDEFADAITTPVIERKDLVAPQSEKKVPLLNYLMDTLQNKFTLHDKSLASSVTDRSVHCQEFYRSLYPEHSVSDAHYRYDQFSTPRADADGLTGRGQAVLKWFYMQNSVDNGGNGDLEAEVVQKCAEEILYKDTPLSVSCLLRSTQDFAQTKRFIDTQHTDTAVTAALYATLVKCNAPELRDNVYLTKPSEMARITLKEKNASEEQLAIICQCVERLTGMDEVDKLRIMGFNVNGLLFNADHDYRKEIICRVARSPNREHLELACNLAVKYNMDALEVWLQHTECDASLTHLTADTLPHSGAEAHARIRETLWPLVRGDDHNALINYFTLLKSIDEKPVMSGLTAAEHIRLLKKARAASQELDYKLLLSQPTAEQFSAHMLQIIRPENVGFVTKFLRTAPPALRIPVSVNAVYTMWLTKYFFTVPANASIKRWMQQYRQCASYFNKLAKEDLLEFIAHTCFAREAVERVPAGTRNLMVMQAVDYCQQEQENDFKYNKNEQTWTQVGQELTRWARFLENFYSTTVQGIIDNNEIREVIWPDIETSHGDADKIVASLSRVVMRAEFKPAALSTLLQCLNVPASAQQVFQHIVDKCVHSADDIQTLVARLTLYHKEGVKFSDELIERVMCKATEFGLPPHKQIGLLSLSQRTRAQDGGDLRKIAQYTIDLFRTEWPDCDYTNALTEDVLVSESGRRAAFSELTARADTWRRRKALLDALLCWPPNRYGESRSPHCEFLQALLVRPAGAGADHKESLALIKLLLRQPLLSEQEVKWVAESASGDAVVNAMWIVLLSKCENSKSDVVKMVLQHKDIIQKEEIEDDLIKELLDNGMFLKLVSTPLYTSIIQYIISRDACSGEPSASEYTVKWATNELTKANYLAEAGHLQLLATGVPSSLRGFTQCVSYAKNMFKK